MLNKGVVFIKTNKIVEVRGRKIGEEGMPLICTPLIEKTGKDILAELNVVLPKKPDLLEWRADYFEDIASFDKVIAQAEKICESAGNIPLLFTLRSSGEGGQSIELTEKRGVELYAAICQSRRADIVDYELSHPEQGFNMVRQAALDNGIKLIGSYHNFAGTPSPGFLEEKLAEAANRGADIAKVAVMPQTPEDVLVLLSVMLKAKALSIPIIAMAMGGIGLPTRMLGGLFGSAVTFAVGEHSSAPGQIPIEDLKVVFNILNKTLGA